MFLKGLCNIFMALQGRETNINNWGANVLNVQWLNRLTNIMIHDKLACFSAIKKVVQAPLTT